MNFDSAALKSRYKSEETESLIRIVNFDSQNYMPEAVDAARLELQERGINPSEKVAVAAVESSIEAEKKQTLTTANIPLHPFLKAICFLFCDIFAVIIALTHSASGKKLAARQAWACFFYGWLLRIGLIFAFTVTR